MNKILALVASSVLAVGIPAAPARADYVNGNQLYEWCSSERSDNQYWTNFARCTAYAAGAVDGLDTGNVFGQVLVGSDSDTIDFICIPPRVTLGQVQEVVTTFLKNNPAIRHDHASVLVVKAVREAWPCRA